MRQILLRESNTGVIVYKGERYPGRHEPLVDKQTFARAMRRLQKPDKPRAAEGGKLLTGLLVCGHCGAKMRYQKWGRAGDKLVCYSRDKSKPHLVHDANCPNRGVMAREVEAVVVRDLSRLAAAPAPLRGRAGDETACRRALDRAQRKLRRLYELYAEGEDDTLREAIEQARRERIRAEQALEAARQAAQQQDTTEAYSALQTIGSSWDRLTAHERQALVRACVQKIVLQNGKIEIYYAIEGAQPCAAEAG